MAAPFQLPPWLSAVIAAWSADDPPPPQLERAPPVAAIGIVQPSGGGVGTTGSITGGGLPRAPLFADTIGAAVTEQTVHMALLLEFGFLSGTYRLWQGYGNLVTSDSKTWQGLGDVGTISGLDQAINGAAPKASLTLSEVTPQGIAVATNSWYEARFRPLTVYLQFFDRNLKLLDSPVAINRFTMQQIEVKFTGPALRDLVIHCEQLFAARGFPTHGWLSDTDQQARYGGDTGCARIPILQYHVVVWPPA
jgi:hypothetical protein